MAMDSSKLATVAVKSAITMIYPTQLVYSCHAKILISMKLDSELPAYYSTTTQSGYNKRRIVAISDNYEETVDLFVARRVRAYLMDFICASLLYVPVESFARLWLRLLLYVGAYAPCDLMESATHVVSYYRGEPRSPTLTTSTFATGLQMTELGSRVSLPSSSKRARHWLRRM